MKIDKEISIDDITDYCGVEEGAALKKLSTTGRSSCIHLILSQEKEDASNDYKSNITIKKQENI